MENEHIDGQLFKKMILAGAQNLENNKKIINALNVFPVPDGDTGTNMSLTMDSAVKEVKGIQSNKMEDIAEAVADGSLMGARGNSGVILSQLFRGFAKSVKGKDKVNTKDLAQALKEASDTAYKAVMKPIEGTILTVARESAEAALIIAKDEEDIIRFIKKVINHAERTLNKTPDMLKVLKDAGVVDSGGKGLLCIYIGGLGAITGEIPDIEIYNQSNNDFTYSHEINEIQGDIEFAYCTEFIIRAENADMDKFKNLIEGYGDSMLVVGNENVVKVHVHTNHPGKIMEYAIDMGPLSDIKIDNMRFQHRHEIFNEEENTKQDKEEKEYGFITVTMGQGLEKIFEDFSVDYIIKGGQTMNPSTEDFIKAIDNVNAKTIFIFPNNSNIFMAANQAKVISNKNIIVIPSKTIPQGLSAILEFDSSISPEENEEEMLEVIKTVKTGQITYAVRDTSYNGLNINQGDILGIDDNEIKAAGKEVKEVSIELIDKMVDGDSEIITIFYGSDIEEVKANELLEILTNKYEDLDIELYYGGQPLYYYIFSVE